MKRLVLAAATVLSLGLGFTAVSAQAGECKPTCYKHPITGQLLCTTPCP